MNWSKYTQATLLALLLIGISAPATSLSTESAMHAGAESQGTSYLNQYMPDIDLSGFLAVTSVQEGKRTTRTNKIAVDQTADFQIDRVCAKTDANPFNSKTYHDVSVWLTFKGSSSDTGKVLKLKQVGSVKEGECLSVKAEDVLVRKGLMYDGRGQYLVEADLVTFDENTQASIITGQGDSGEIELIETATEDPAAETAKGEISMSPIAVKEQDVKRNEEGDLIKDGDWAKVKQGEEITFTLTPTQGEIGEVDWALRDIEQVPGYDFYQTTDTESPWEFTYTFDEPGAVAVRANIESRYKESGSSTTSKQFFVMSDKNKAPDADLQVKDGGATVRENEDIYLTLSDSTDPDGSIRWMSYKYDSDNGMIVKTGDTARFNFDNPGTYTVTGEVTDNEGATDTETIRITVEDDPEKDSETTETTGDGEFCQTYPNAPSCATRSMNQPPVITGIETPDSVAKGDSFEVTVSASDPDDDSLTYKWSNGDTGKNAEYQASSTGSRDISVTVRDGEGGTSTEEATVYVTRADDDGDGLINTEDECPETFGEASNGCPTPVDKPVTPTKRLDVQFEKDVEKVFETSSFLNFLAAGSTPEKVSENQLVQAELDVSIEGTKDRSTENGEYTTIYVRSAVLEEGNVSSTGNWKPAPSNHSMYSESFERRFSEPGNYAYYLTSYLVTQRYDAQNQTWTVESVNRFDTSKYTFQVSESSIGTGGTGDSSPSAALPEPVRNVASGGSAIIAAIFFLLSVIGAILYKNWKKNR